MSILTFIKVTPLLYIGPAISYQRGITTFNIINAPIYFFSTRLMCDFKTNKKISKLFPYELY